MAAPLAFVTFASFFGAEWWLLDLLSHFRVQLLIASLISAAALLAFSRMAAVVALIAFAANAVPVAPYLQFIAGAESSRSSHIRVMTLNLHGNRTRHDALRALVEQEEPDVILLTELPKDEGHLIASLGSRYPHRVWERRASPFDVVLLSRWTIQDWFVDRSAASFLPVLSTRVCDPTEGARCLTLVGLHAARPLGSSGRLQDGQLRVAAAAARAAPKGRVVAMGDLNLTPWSASFARFIQNAGLNRNPQQRGLSATWLSRFPALGLMIDHVLTGPGVRMVRTRVGPDVGSDHFPVIAELALDPDYGEPNRY